MSKSNRVRHFGKTKRSNSRTKKLSIIIATTNCPKFIVRKSKVSTKFHHPTNRTALVASTDRSMSRKYSKLSSHIPCSIKIITFIFILSKNIKSSKNSVSFIKMQNFKIKINFFTKFNSRNTKNYFLHQTLIFTIIVANTIFTIKVVSNVSKLTIFRKKSINTIRIRKCFVFPNLDFQFTSNKRNSKSNTRIAIVSIKILHGIFIRHTIFIYGLTNIPIFVNRGDSNIRRAQAIHGTSCVTIQRTKSARIVTSTSSSFHTDRKYSFCVQQ